MNNIGNIPDGKPLSIDIKKNVGNALTGPNPQPIAKTAKEAKQAAIADLNRFAAQYGKPSTLKYDKPYTFNSDVNGKNFERYYAHPKFKQFGFSPFRDNETVYNQGSSLWDDTSRAAKQFLPLAGLAVSGVYGGWDDFLSGKPDVDNAIEMERYMNIGSSSREGFGAKALNFGVNSAYTVGVIGSILTEEAVLFAASRIPGMQGLAAAGTAKNMLTLGKAFNRLYDVFKAGSEINQAKKVWNGVGKVSRAVLPFQNTADLFRTAQRAEMGWDKMNDFAKAYKSFGSFYRDLREINLVTSEAKLEGGFVQNDVANELIKQFREKENRDPNDKESADIYDQALKAGFKTSYANIAGIYASNKVVLNKLLKGIPGAASLEHAASKSVRGTIVKNSNWLKTGKNPYEVVYGLKKFGNAEWLKQATKALPLSGARYMTANIMEGTQEVYQEAVAEAMKKYYIDTFNDPSRAHQGFMMEALNHGLKSQFSDQGLEVFLSGFLMAGPIQIAGLSMTKAGQYTNMLNLKRQEKAFANDPNNAGKDNPYTKKLNEFKDWDAKVVGAINDLTKNKKDYFSKLYRNTKEQKDLGDLYEEATLNDDTKTAVDTRDDSLFTHIKTLRKSGTLDIFKEELKALSQLSDDELAEAFNEKPGANPVDGKTVSQRIDTVLQRIDDIDKHFTEVEKVVNLYDPKQDFFKWFGFEEARDLVAYNDYSYKRIGDRMISIQEDIKNAMASVGLDSMYSDIAPLFSVGRGGNILMGATDNFGMENEIDLLTKEIESLQGATDPQLIKRKDRLSRKKKTLSSLSLAAQNTVVAYKLLNKPNQTQEEQDENSERVAEAEKLLHDAFKKHMQTLSERGAAGASYAMFDKTIDELFVKYKDLWRLDADKTNVANAINILYNPEVFAQSVDRLAKAAEEADAIKAEQAKKMAAEFEKRHATNDFLNDLISKFNVFVSEEEAEAYLANDTIPRQFIDADTGYEIDPRKDAEKYQKILDLIDEYDDIYFQRTGQRLFKPNREDTGIRVAGRIKDTDKVVGQLVGEFNPDDKRTYDQIADQFGFDKKAQSSELSVDTVLKGIINSKFSTVVQKELARKLMSLIDANTIVTFRKNMFTHSGYSDQSGILVDARYSSTDFDNLVGVPIEYSILNAIGQKIVYDALTGDKVFSDRIDELLELAKKGIAEKDRAYYAYALNNKVNFVTELLNNPDFQSILNAIDYEQPLTEQTKEAKTLWGSFLDALKDVLNSLFNILDPKLLNEAMIVVTNKLGTSSIPSSEKSEVPPGKPTQTVDYTDQVLVKKLRDRYEQILAKATPEEKVNMTFENWVAQSMEAKDIIKQHNVKKKVGEEGSKNNMTRDAIVRKLTAIGKTIQELNDMSDTEIADLLNRFDQLSATYVPNLNNQDWGEVDVVMQQAFDKVKAAGVKLNKEENVYEQTVVVGDQSIRNTFERVSHVVKKKSQKKPDEVSTQRGNIIDRLFKEFFKGNLQNIDDFEAAYKEIQKENPLVTFDTKALREIFDTARTAQNKLREAGLKVIPDFPILFGKLGNIATAGEMDILAYNKQGQVFIIDIKTALNTNRRFAYEVNTEFKTILGDKYFEFITALKDSNGMLLKAIETFSEKEAALGILLANKILDITDRYSAEKALTAQGKDIKIYLGYQEDDLRQQLAYKELLRQTTGLQATALSILPITVTNSPTNRSVVTSAKLIPDKQLQPDGTLQPKPKAPLLLTIDNSKTIYDLNIEGIEPLVNTYPENPLAKKAPQPPAPATSVSDIEAKKQEALEKKIQDLEEQRRALRSEDGSVPADKMAEFNRLNSEINKAKVAAKRGNSTQSMLIKRFADGADTATTDPEALSAEDKKEAADIIEQVIQNSKSADEAFDKIRRLGYVFDIAVTQALKSYLNDRFDPAAPKVGNNKDSFQAWIYGKTDKELAALEGKPAAPTTASDIEGQVGTSNYSVDSGLIFYNNPDGTVTPVPNPKGEPVRDVIIADIERRRQEELLGKSFTETTEKVARGKGQSAGKTIVRFTESKISSDGEVLTIKPKAKFKNEDIPLTTTPETITVKEFKEQFYENLSEQDKEMFDEFFTDDSITRIKLVEARIGLKGNAKGQVNIEVTNLEGQGFSFELQNGKEINAKYDAELATLEGKQQQESSEETKKGKEKDPKAKEKAAVKRKLSDLRASINKIETKDEMSKFRLLLTTAQELGILDEIKNKQGITPEVYKALMDQKLSQIANQVTISDLISQDGPVIFTYINKKGQERTGRVIGQVQNDPTKIEIVDITEEIKASPTDWSFAGSGKSIILSEKDVNKQVLAITEQPDLPKPDSHTKQQSNAGEEVSGNDLEARKEAMKKIDINDPNAANNAANDLFNNCGNIPI